MTSFIARTWSRWTRSQRPRRSPCALTVETLEARDVPAGGITDPGVVVPQPSAALPAVGVPFTDPAFGTTIVRVSDSSQRGGFESQIYSQLQAFSADDSYLLLTGSAGYVIRRLSDLSAVNLDTSSWNAPRWLPGSPNTLIHYDTNADDRVRVQLTNVDTGATTDIFTFPAQYTTVFNNQSFDELSLDGKWMSGMVRRNDGEQVIFALDVESRSLGAVLPLGQVYTTHARPDPIYGRVPPDWVGVSPLGRSLVVAWARDGTVGASGVETFDLRTGAFLGRVNDGHQHGDLGVMPDGQTEYYATFEVYGSPEDRSRPAIGVRLLPGEPVVSEPQALRSIDWGNAEHISGQGPAGTLLVTSGRDASNGYTAFEGEVWIQNTDGSVLRLAHHRSSSRDYWVQPRATLSHSGRYAVFASDWGRNTGGLGDPFLIDLGAGLPPATAPDVTLDALANRTVNEGSTLTFTATADSANGDEVRFSLSGAPAGATIDPVSGVFNWTPTEAQGPATYAVRVVATSTADPTQSAVRTVQVTVNEVNQAPQLAFIPDQSVVRGRTLRLTASATDADLPGSGLRYRLAAGAPATARIDPVTGALRWTPAATSRPRTVEMTVIVTDTGSLSDSETFLVTVRKNATSFVAANVVESSPLSEKFVDALFGTLLEEAEELSRGRQRSS